MEYGEMSQMEAWDNACSYHVEALQHIGGEIEGGPGLCHVFGNQAREEYSHIRFIFQEI